MDNGAQASLPIIDLGQALPQWRRVAERAATVALWGWWACLLKPAVAQVLMLATVSWRIILAPPKAVAVARTAAAKFSMHDGAAKLALHHAAVAEKLARVGLETYVNVAPVRDLVAGFSQIEAAGGVLCGLALIYWAASRVGFSPAYTPPEETAEEMVIPADVLIAARSSKIVLVSHTADARLSGVEDFEAFREKVRGHAPAVEVLDRLAS